MRDIPVFSTENGVASLFLKEIPYSFSAYIRIHDSLAPEALLDECVSFCKAVGAEHIYASGHVLVEKYPFHTTILQMSRLRKGIDNTDAELVPVTETSLDQWRCIYNEKMKAVPNSAYMSEADAKKMLKREDGYFVFKRNTLLGIGMANGNQIDAIASVVPGSGESIVLALCNVLTEDIVTLQVASTNQRAVDLYHKMGFTITAEISKWYKIL